MERLSLKRSRMQSVKFECLTRDEWDKDEDPQRVFIPSRGFTVRDGTPRTDKRCRVSSGWKRCECPCRDVWAGLQTGHGMRRTSDLPSSVIYSAFRNTVTARFEILYSLPSNPKFQMFIRRSLRQTIDTHPGWYSVAVCPPPSAFGTPCDPKSTPYHRPAC
jgi:hypothetical protein